jgi:hypothetical protein
MMTAHRPRNFSLSLSFTLSVIFYYGAINLT